MEFFELPPLYPIVRLLLGLSLGLLLASLLEAFQLTRAMSRLALPLVRHAHLGCISSSAFALSLFSPASSNALLGDNLLNGNISKKEVLVSNLFNSLPSALTHTPTIFLMMFPVIGFSAFIYIAIVLLAATGRTLFTIILGRCLLSPSPLYTCPEPMQKEKIVWKDAGLKALKKFKSRLPRLLYITLPIYIIIFYAQHFGIFQSLENYIVQHLGLTFINPETLSIILLYMTAELNAALAVAGTLMISSSISMQDIVLALLLGNIVSTPMRGLRHQLPAYATYFPTDFAIQLVSINQALRAFSLIIATVFYYMYAF